MPTVREMLSKLSDEEIRNNFSSAEIQDLMMRADIEENPPGVPDLRNEYAGPKLDTLSRTQNALASLPFGAALMGTERTPQQRGRALRLGGGALGAAMGLGPVSGAVGGGIGAAIPPQTPGEAAMVLGGAGIGKTWKAASAIPEIKNAATGLRGLLAGSLGVGEMGALGAAGTGIDRATGNAPAPSSTAGGPPVPKGIQGLLGPLMAGMSFALPAFAEVGLRGITRNTPFMRSELGRERFAAGKTAEQLAREGPIRQGTVQAIQQDLAESQNARMTRLAQLRQQQDDLKQTIAATELEGLSRKADTRVAHSAEMTMYKRKLAESQAEISVVEQQIAEMQAHNVGQRGGVQSLTGKQARQRFANQQRQKETIGGITVEDAATERQLHELRTKRAILDTKVAAGSIDKKDAAVLKQKLYEDERLVRDTVFNQRALRAEALAANTHTTSADAALIAQQGNVQTANRTVADRRVELKALQARKTALRMAGVPENLVAQVGAEEALRIKRLDVRRKQIDRSLGTLRTEMSEFKKGNPISPLANEADPSKWLGKVFDPDTSDYQLRELVGFLQQRPGGAAKVKTLQDTIMQELFDRTYDGKVRMHNGLANLMNSTDPQRRPGFGANKLAALFSNEDPQFVQSLTKEIQELADTFQSRKPLPEAWQNMGRMAVTRALYFLPTAFLFMRNSPMAMTTLGGTMAVVAWPRLLEASAKNPRIGMAFRKWIEEGATSQALAANPWLQKELMRIGRPVDDAELKRLSGEE